MGSRLTNTSWCWSPRKRCPEHAPSPPRKYTNQWYRDEDERLWALRERNKNWSDEGCDPDIGSIGGTYKGKDLTDSEWWKKGN
jgi:hypothetical protein